MTKVAKRRQLNTKQENAIDLLIQGKSDRKVAEAVEVARQTVTGWRNNNALFIAELNRQRKEVWGAQTERLRQLVAKAVGVLAEDLEQKENLRLRQSASVHILKTVGLYGTDLEPKGEVVPEDVEKRWREGAAFKIFF